MNEPMDHDQESLDSASTWFSETKIRMPRMPIHLVPRQRLIDILDRSAERRLTLITAPAGFGKSTLLAQWRDSLRGKAVKCAWIGLDEDDGEIHQFLSYVILSLAMAEVDVGRLEISAENGLLETSVRSVTSNILRVLQEAQERVILILDDYHRLNSPDVDAFLLDLLSRCPDNFHLVISSRVRPNLNAPTLLASGEATEIWAETLRFSDEELRAAFEGRLNDRAFELLQAKVEGWAVAVQLAKLLLSGDEDIEQALMRLHGHRGHIASYLTDQIIATLPDDQRTFILKTSILDKFNASLADAVCERKDSLNILKALEPLHALLVPIDNDYEWFRYHHLFAECLHDQLRQTHSDEYEALHRRASRWLEENGYYSDAVRHARMIGDYSLCAELISNAGGWELILFGGIGYLRNLVWNIPDSELPNYPRMQVAKAYLSLKDGQVKTARALFDSAEAQSKDYPGDEKLERDLLNVRVLLETYEDNMLVDPDNELLHGLNEKLSQYDAVTAGIIQCQLSLRYAAFGNFEAASEQARNAMRSMRQADTVLGLNYCYIHAGMSAFYQGAYQVAYANFEQAEEMAADNFGADSGLKYVADVCMHALLFWRGDLQEEGYERLRKALAHVQDYDGWLDIYAIGFDACFHQALHDQDFDGALRTVEQMKMIAWDRGLRRLDQLAEALTLLALVHAGARQEAALEYEAISDWYEPGAWKNNRWLWLTHVAAANACALHFKAEGEHGQAFAHIEDAIACAAALGANFHLLRSHLVKADIFEKGGDREAAMGPLLAALDLGARERLRQPFIGGVAEKLLRALRGKIRWENQNIIVANFISDILGLEARQSQTGGEGNVLSDREVQVIEELSLGKSNKEIARALDMTENTVKFHLKNIFAKLNVSRRLQAVTAARQRNLID